LAVVRVAVVRAAGVRAGAERPELAAGLRRAGPDGSARESPELPPRGRVDSLGARVAMIPR
ncbi:MAG TPA: hypothetical protein VGD68_13980, partial [Streptosporangiaceae bacterium]